MFDFVNIAPLQPIQPSRQHCIKGLAVLAALIAAWLGLPSHQLTQAQQPVESETWHGFGFPCSDNCCQCDCQSKVLRRQGKNDEPCLHFAMRPQDEVWLVSTRHLCGFCCSESVPKVKSWDGCIWNEMTPEALINQIHADRSRLNVVFVHGHRTDADWSIRRGTEAYQATFGNSATAPPVRFVIWSWPSDPQPRLIKNFKENSSRACVDGRWLGWFLGQIDDSNRVSLMGYSLGTQVLFTALEHLALQECDKVDHGEATASGDGRFDMSIIAPVTHCCWSCDSCRVAQVYSQVRSMVVFRNSDDRALAAFDLFCKHQTRRRPHCRVDSIDAFCDPSCKICQIDVAQEVGAEHNFVHYICAMTVQSLTRSKLIGPFTGGLAVTQENHSHEVFVAEEQ